MLAKIFLSSILLIISWLIFAISIFSFFNLFALPIFWGHIRIFRPTFEFTDQTPVFSGLHTNISSYTSINSASADPPLHHSIHKKKEAASRSFFFYRERVPCRRLASAITFSSSMVRETRSLTTILPSMYTSHTSFPRAA